MFGSIKSKFNRDFTEDDLMRELRRAPVKMSFASEEAARSWYNALICNVEGCRREGIFDAHDIYRIFDFAENWARLMEAVIIRGQELTEEQIDRCEDLADTIMHCSGSVYGAARNLLIRHWRHGKLLLTERESEQLGTNMSEYFVTNEEATTAIRDALANRS